MEDVLEIPVQQEQFQQEPDPPKKKLWKNLSDKHLYTKSYEDFEKQFSTPESIDKLYSVVSSKQLYTKSNEDFKSQFFPQPAVKKKSSSVDFAGSSLEAGNAQSIGGDGSEIPTKEYYTTSTGEMVETDPISLSQKYNELKNSTKEIEGLGDRGTMRVVADEEKVKAAKKLREDFKDTDLEGIYSETKDLPEGVLRQFQGELLQDRETNPQLYQRKLSNLKWRSEFEKKILSDVDNGNISADEYNQIKHTIEMLPIVTGEGNYTNQRPAIQSLAKDIQLYGGGNKDKLLKDFAVEVSKVYGNPDSKAAETFKSTPESKYLTPEAQLGYQYIQDVSPEKSEQYKRLFIDTKNLSPDEQRGYNHLMLTLEETGIGVQQNAVNEELNNLSNIAEKNGGLTEEQISKAEKLEKQLNELQIKSDELDSKYPERLRDKVSDAVNEIMGKDIGWGSYAMVKTGQAFKNTAQGIWEAVSSPFMSDESNSLRELAIMGEHIESESNLRQPDKNKGLQYDKLIIQPELQEQVDKIKNDSLLSDEEKRNKLFSLFYSNKDKFGRIPIVNGRFNINPSSILYGITDLGASLVPFVVIEAATGGIGGTGSAAKFLRTFNAAAATTFHDEYAGALLEGKSQSEAYKSAMATTAINSFAMAGAATPTELKAIAKGNSSAEKIIQNMSDDAIQKVLDRGTPKGLKAIASNVKDRAKKLPSNVLEGVKTGAKFEAYMAGANTLNDREVDFKQMLLGVANFGILGAGLAQIGHKSPTEFQKSAGLKFGEKPDDFIVIAEQMKKDGQLNEAEFEHRKSLIEQYSEAYKTLPKANSNGKPLDENQKAEYLYNAVIKNEGNKGKSTLPPKQAEKAEKTALVADHKNDLILDPKTDKQLESRKSLLKKQLEKKDENGKPELSDKERKDYEAELEAVNDAIENKPEVKEQPLEGKGEVSTVKTKEEGDIEYDISNVSELKKNADYDGKQYIEDKIEPRIEKIERNEKNIANIKKELEKRQKEEISSGKKSVLPYDYYDLINESRRAMGLKEIPHISELSIDELLDHLSENIKGVEKQKADANELIKTTANNLKKDGRLTLPTQSKATVKEGEIKQTINEQTKTTEVPKSTEEKIITETEPNKEVQGAEPFVEEKRTILSHRGLQEVATEFGFGDVTSRELKTDPQLFKDAQNTVDKWTEKGEYPKRVNDLVEKAENAEVLTDEQRVILQQHIANVRGEMEGMDINAPEYNSRLTELNRLIRAGETTRSAAGAALRVPFMASVPNDLPTMLVEEMNISRVSELTESQKATVKKEYDQIFTLEKSYQQKVEALEAENAKLRAAKTVASEKATTKKTKKVHEDFVTERKKISESISEKLKKARQETSAVVVPYAKELIAIAPDVAKLMKSYVEEGVIKLEEITKKIHEELKGYIPDLKEKDIHDIIAGKYNEKRQTKNEIAEKIENIRIQAKLVNKLEALYRGEEPKNEQRKIKRNADIEKLRNEIKDIAAFDREVTAKKEAQLKSSEKSANKLEKDLRKAENPELSALNSLKTRMANEKINLEMQIRTGKFSIPEKKTPIKLDKEAIDLRDKLIKARQNREVRLLLQQRMNETGTQKGMRVVAEVLNIPRTLMTIADYSALLRQDLFFAVGHPVMTTAATKEMFKQGWSQKLYDRWFADLKEHPRYDTMQKSRLSISDSLNHDLTKREEDFMSSVSEKIPLIGKTVIKGSERSYTALLNKSRVDMFNYFADAMEGRGVTYENNPKAYKAMAEYINNATGRSDFGETLNRVAPVLNSIFFSPRLIASRVNMLTYWMQPRFWKSVPKEVRIDYMRNWISLLAIGGTFMALAKMGGADVEDDPRSSDFGKIKSGDTRWDMWGGAQPYIRVLAQLTTGQRKSTNTGKMYDLNGDDIFGETRAGVITDFFRNKLAPVPGAAVDILSGRTGVGDKVVYQIGGAGNKEISLDQYVIQRILPMTITGTYEALGDQGVKALLTVGIPNTFGVSTQTYAKTPPKSKKTTKKAKKPKKKQ